MQRKPPPPRPPKSPPLKPAPNVGGRVPFGKGLPSARRSARRPLLIGGGIIATIMVVVVILVQNIPTPTELPKNFNDLQEVSEFAPANSELFITAKVSVFEDVVTRARQAMPEAFSLIDSVTGIVTTQFDQLEILLRTRDWLGEEIGFAIFPATTKKNWHYVFVAKISDRERALNALSGTVGVLSEIQGVVNGMIHYRVTHGPDVLLSDQLVAITDGYDQLPMVSSTISFAGNDKFAQITSSLTFANYEALIVFDTRSTWWTQVQTLFDLAPMQSLQPYFGVAIAQPDETTTLIDISQVQSPTDQFYKSTGKTLLSFAPMSSLAIMEIGNFKAMYDRILDSLWIREQFPQFPHIVEVASQVVKVATSLDYRTDFIDQMSQNLLLYVNIASDVPSQIEWGSVIQAQDSAAMRTTFDRVAFNLPGRGVLMQPLLEALVPSLRFDLHTESVNGSNILVLDLPNNNDRDDIAMAMLNNAEELALGNRSVVESMMVSRPDVLFNYGHYLPYILDHATMSFVGSDEVFFQFADLLSGIGLNYNSKDARMRLNGVFSSIYVGASVSRQGIEMARIVLVR